MEGEHRLETSVAHKKEKEIEEVEIEEDMCSQNVVICNACSGGLSDILCWINDNSDWYFEKSIEKSIVS